MRIFRAFGIAALCSAWLLASGCGSPEPPPEHVAGTFEDREVQVFNRRSSLVDMAVLDSGAAPGAIKEEKKGGRIFEFKTVNGRKITVESLEDNAKTRVTITHKGRGGIEGAKEAMLMIEEWMGETDIYRDRTVERTRTGLPPIAQ